MWTTPARLRAKGIIGMNRRNIRYIGRYNNRRLYPLVDDKLKTKLLAQEYGITTPALIGTVTTQFGVKHIVAMLVGHPGFVIKPAKGSGGKGILVIESHADGWFRKGSGEWLPRHRIVRYLSNLLAGLYTLGGTPDVAVVEALVEIDPEFAAFSHAGVPDIRIVVYQGYPVMAMMRLSTAASDGKANLHQGAIGAGVDLATGLTMTAVFKNDVVDNHPVPNAPITDVQVPHWQELMDIAARCYDLTGLGYFGVDMVLDKNLGPMILEMNARPGLNIQIANRMGLLHRLELIRTHAADLKTVAARLEFARTRIAPLG
jgi:alpha-L-glutamate ligase-like protein